ncbi:MAG TPA: hypothetical protein VGM89_07800 [Puia sp.]|jgi:hypothetical protein
MQHILQHLFQADTLGDVPRERLEALVEEYPSFGIARYLLSSKLRAEQAEQFEEETRKTNLYFPNPFWLQWMLQQESGNGVEESIGQPEAQYWVEEPKPEYVAEEQWQEEEHHAGPVVAEELMAQPVEEILAETAAEPQEAAQPLVEQPTAQPPEEQPTAQPVAEQTNAQPLAEQTAAQPLAEPPKTEERIIEQPLVFESYHMIDYFASQGIKLAPDENPADRLGKQMKSFTEWLKVMKRLPQKEKVTASDIVAENRIQAIAAHSIEGKEVVTETMAEVLAMQGMREKAAEVYHKLSLLDPGKSGYFAAKIEQLKTN